MQELGDSEHGVEEIISAATEAGSGVALIMMDDIQGDVVVVAFGKRWLLSVKRIDE